MLSPQKSEYSNTFFFHKENEVIPISRTAIMKAIHFTNSIRDSKSKSKEDLHV